MVFCVWLQCDFELVRNWRLIVERAGFEVEMCEEVGLGMGRVLYLDSCAGVQPTTQFTGASTGRKYEVCVLALPGTERGAKSAMRARGIGIQAMMWVVTRKLIAAGAEFPEAKPSLTYTALLGCVRELAERWWIPIEKAGIEVKPEARPSRHSVILDYLKAGTRRGGIEVRLETLPSGLMVGEARSGRTSVGICPVPMWRGAPGGLLHNEFALCCSTVARKPELLKPSHALAERLAQILIDAGAEVELRWPG